MSLVIDKIQFAKGPDRLRDNYTVDAELKELFNIACRLGMTGAAAYLISNGGMPAALIDDVPGRISIKNGIAQKGEHIEFRRFNLSPEWEKAKVLDVVNFGAVNDEYVLQVIR